MAISALPKNKRIGAVILIAALIVMYWVWKKTNIVSDVMNKLSLNSPSNLSAAQRSMVQVIILVAGQHDYSDHASFLLGAALEESSFNQNAKSTANAYGLFQIQHTKGWSWLRHFGYTDADADRLYDPIFNTAMAISIFKYFESRGFAFPDQADIYNVGETKWAEGVRNADYQRKVASYTAMFAPIDGESA